MEEKCQGGGGNLSDDRGVSRALNAHLRAAQPSVNHDGVQNDVDHRAGDLGDGGVEGTPGGLEDLLIDRKEDNAEGEAAADLQIVDGHLDDDLAYASAGVLGVDVGGYAENPHQNKNNRNHESQKCRVSGSLIDLLLVSLLHGSGQKGIGANARAYGYGHHEQLDGESQPQRCQSFLAGFPHVGQIGAVHNVVDSLKHHGEHNRQSHGQHQTPYRFFAHFTVLFFFHWFWISFRNTKY